MINMLRDWAMLLSGVVVFASICEVLLPDSSFQKYIRLSVGLLLVLTLISPLRQLLNIKLPETMDNKNNSIAYAERENMEERQKKEVMRAYKAGLNKKMLLSIESRLGDIPAEIRCKVDEENEESFGMIEEVQILVDVSESGDITQNVMEILKRDYGLEEKRVKVRYLKESSG